MKYVMGVLFTLLLLGLFILIAVVKAVAVILGIVAILLTLAFIGFGIAELIWGDAESGPGVL